MNITNFNWKQMKYVQKLHRTLYALGFGQVIGRIILLLTTVGRKTGLKRVTPVQYEQINRKYYLSSARGLQADWVRNIQCNPQVDVQVRSLRFHGAAEVVSDPARIADFIELRLQRHPVMLGAIMQKAHGLPKHPNRAQLEKLAEKEALVIITPDTVNENEMESDLRGCDIERSVISKQLEKL